MESYFINALFNNKGLDQNEFTEAEPETIPVESLEENLTEVKPQEKRTKKLILDPLDMAIKERI